MARTELEAAELVIDRLESQLAEARAEAFEARSVLQTVQNAHAREIAEARAELDAIRSPAARPLHIEGCPYKPYQDTVDAPDEELPECTCPEKHMASYWKACWVLEKAGAEIRNREARAEIERLRGALRSQARCEMCCGPCTNRSRAALAAEKPLKPGESENQRVLRKARDRIIRNDPLAEERDDE